MKNVGINYLQFSIAVTIAIVSSCASKPSFQDVHVFFETGYPLQTPCEGVFLNGKLVGFEKDIVGERGFTMDVIIRIHDTILLPVDSRIVLEKKNEYLNKLVIYKGKSRHRIEKYDPVEGILGSSFWEDNDVDFLGFMSFEKWLKQLPKKASEQKSTRDSL